jgi:ABC-type transporter MlaC component
MFVFQYVIFTALATGLSIYMVVKTSMDQNTVQSTVTDFIDKLFADSDNRQAFHVMEYVVCTIYNRNKMHTIQYVKQNIKH